MRIYTPDGVIYRRCIAGDEREMHAAVRGSGPSYRDVLDGLSAQLAADDDDDYRTLAAGKRVVVAVRQSVFVAFVEITLARAERTRWKAEVEGWTVPGRCHPEQVLDCVGDALVWLRDIGAARAIVTAHVRGWSGAAPGTEETTETPARRATWTADPIPDHPLGLPRNLTYAAE